MKRISTSTVLLAITLMLPASMLAQERSYSTFYYQRASLFEKLPTRPTDIIFLGNSITNGGEWMELLNDPRVKNRGISGDICMGVYDRLEPILKGKPAKLFLMIGVNDLSRGTHPDTIVAQINMILDRIARDSPNTRVFLQSILPVNEQFIMFERHTRYRETIPVLNRQLEQLARSKGIVYINLFPHFVEPGSDRLDPKYSNDGLHLMGEGYLKWVEIIQPYLSD